MALFQADIDRLNALSTTLQNVAAAIDGIDVRTASKSIDSALPGTTLGAACDLAAEYAEGAWLRVSQRTGQVATAITTVAADVKSTDDTFAASMRKFEFSVPEPPR